MILNSRIIEEIFNDRVKTECYFSVFHLFQFIFINTLIEIFKLDWNFLNSNVLLWRQFDSDNKDMILLSIKCFNISEDSIERHLNMIEKSLNIKLKNNIDKELSSIYSSLPSDTIFYKQYYIEILDREKFSKDILKYYTYFKLLNRIPDSLLNTILDSLY